MDVWPVLCERQLPLGEAIRTLFTSSATTCSQECRAVEAYCRTSSRPLFWNCRGLRASWGELRALLSEFSPACVALQETRLGLLSLNRATMVAQQS
ncbi:hypothetical protein E2C01_058335 [Portunus trituberculatus]|uniref:Endonuclease/exonuclease/phosphatase domain-containing protein n=1 Tax=Portunus trituberculatus TaxID=210409 RepID=A0A5B7H5T8_PORTR|nr:hypothetical protein [Portunus trituberculatus]